MNLLEFEGKRLFAEYGISIPSGSVYDGSNLPEAIVFPAVVKAQVPIGGRGKAGGIRIIENEKELESAVSNILGMDIRGHIVRQVLIEERVKGDREIYLSIAVDRSRRCPLIMTSSMGGMDIEGVPDEQILREWVDPWIGPSTFTSRNLTYSLEFDDRSARQFASLLKALWQLFRERDAELVEINPLIVKSDGSLVAADSKVVIDDDALYRHSEFHGSHGDVTPLERKAREKGIAFVQLDGNIGVIANGAGLTMATLDFLTLHGGRGGVFLDLGGTDDPAKVQEALLLMSEAGPKVILVNIFGGITKCDTVASGLLSAMKEGGIDIPIVARIKGVNEERAVELLDGSGIVPVLYLDEAARKVVDIAGEG